VRITTGEGGSATATATATATAVAATLIDGRVVDADTWVVALDI
jgi:hypothetical protein